MRQKGSFGADYITLVGIITIIFVMLKLFEIISWSWVWVLSPLWISLLLIILITIIGLIILKKRRKH